MRTLVVCAHPDDETLGVGGTIAKWTANEYEKDVFVVALTNGVTSRPDYSYDDLTRRHAAFDDACKVLGITAHHVLQYQDQALDTNPQCGTAATVAEMIRQYQPDRILTHHLGDLNKDHRLTAEAVLVACRPPNKCDIYTFETPSSTEWAYGMTPAFQPNVFVDIGETIGRKEAALKCYADELRDMPHPRGIEAIATRAAYWGQHAGMFFAEPLMLLRGIR